MRNTFANTLERASGSLTKSELTSVTAVIAYLAYEHDVSETTVCALLTKEFGVDDVKEISTDAYDDVIRFLVDFNFDEFIQAKTFLN